MNWILFVARRFAHVDRTGRSAVTGFLASLSICFGVMTLIVVVSVMNGFQLSFIDSIMEISSAHIRVEVQPGFDEAAFNSFCAEPGNGIRAAVPFYEAQSLAAGDTGQQSPALIRAVPPEICRLDSGFAREVNMISGRFLIASPDTIVLGSGLARQLGVRVGSSVNLLALSGGSDVDLISDNRVFTVTGIFSCGYADINSTYAFISLEAGRKMFGAEAREWYGIKLEDSNQDMRVMQYLEEQIPGISTESWRSYNRSFFGALRIEKNLLMMLVLLIFVVVGVNIFNGMRRMVFERREEIAVLSALGGLKKNVQLIFIIRGLVIGLSGAVPGLIFGLLMCINMETIFMVLSKVSFGIQYFFTMLTDAGSVVFLRENPMYQVYARIPARMLPFEVLCITVFGVFSSLTASWTASRNIQSLSIAEVLHDE